MTVTKTVVELQTLIELLADGRFRSGEEIGERLGVSRAAVWKRLQQLQPLGLEVHAVRGRGYRLARPVDLLRAERILERLQADTRGLCPGIDIPFSVDSTSAWLQRRGQSSPKGQACVAEYQTAGRGRRGRHWVSPFGSNIYLSLLWRFEGTGQTAGLSLAVAVAVTEALERLGARHLTLKWPNDVLFEGRKLAGILIEVTGEATGGCQVIIGIGVNVGMPAAESEAIDQPWADLTETGASPERNRVAGSLLDALIRTLARFEREGLDRFLGAWRSRDCMYGQPVSVQFAEGSLQGVGRGVDQFGQFLVEHAGGTERLNYGEVSLRRLGG